MSFAPRLYPVLKSSGRNVVYSPASIRLALAMTSVGARGKTLEQMREVLGDRQDALSSTVRVANRLWVAAGHDIDPTFVKDIERRYQGSVATLDFAAAPGPSREAINEWASRATAGKIAELLAADALDAQTSLLLTNALYFSAKWATAFEAEATRDAPFFSAKGTSIDVPTMHRTNQFALSTFNEGRMLQLPYVGHKVSLLILLPSTTAALALLEKRYAAGDLGTWLSQGRSELVNVHLPKFTARGNFELSESLQFLGMPDAFEPGVADFSGIDRSNTLALSKVVHQTFVVVDEAGTEAAAATSVGVGEMGVPKERPEPIEFDVNRPFLFLIHDVKNDSTLFAGRVLDPSL